MRLAAIGTGVLLAAILGLIGLLGYGMAKGL
jgi:hypothetical protein